MSTAITESDLSATPTTDAEPQDPRASAAPGETVALPWHLALSLPERTARGALRSPAGESIGTSESADPLRGWRVLCGTDRADGDEELTRRLAQIGADPQVLGDLLRESADDLRDRRGPEPAWHARFVDWWSRPARPGADAGTLGLLEIARPLLDGASADLAAAVRERLATAAPQVGVAAEEILSDPDHLVRALLQTLPVNAVLTTVQRTLVLELNVARVQGRLTGDTPDERFADFVRSLGESPRALEIWTEYPVLARLVIEQLTGWIATRVELLDALVADLPTLRAAGLVDPAATRLTALDFGAGDSHRGGRSVATVRFDVGRVMFKPRSLSVDEAFDRLLAWVNDSPLAPALRRPVVVDRGDHGWVEFIDATQSTDEAGADRYAVRIGILTAMLYLLHATDFHHENVLAAGDQPVLVDLEALLHTEKTAAVVRNPETDDVAAAALIDSVHSIGLLPIKMLVRDEDHTFAYDLSAIGGHGGQLSPMQVSAMDGAGTDRMRLVSRRIELGGHRNRPLDAAGREIDLTSRGDMVRRGFARAYRLLLDSRDELLAVDGPLAGFAAATGRHIARATSLYARLLAESTHPDFLRDALDRDRCLFRLAGAHSDRTDPALAAAMVGDEFAELHRGDIPMFGVDLGTGGIRGGLDDRLLGRLDRSPVDAVAERVRSLSDADREFQERVIVGCFAGATMARGDARWGRWTQPRSTGAGPVSGDEFAAAAQAVADRLGELAVRGERPDGAGPGVGWIGLELVDEEFWQLSAAGLDLYSGLSGITLALDAVAAVTGDRATAELAAQGYDRLADQLRALADSTRDLREKDAEADIGVGAFGVLGGPLYALATGAVRHGRADLADAAVGLAPLIARLAPKDRLLDVVAGSAGAVLALLAVEDAAPGRGALSAAEVAAERLLATGQPQSAGLGWPTRLSDGVPLVGLSHGAGGMALALARLAARQPADRRDARLITTATAALDYEATAFDPDRVNWRDLRTINPSGDASMVAWCHGAAGVAGVRRALLDLDVLPGQRDRLAAELATALQGVAATGLGATPVSGLNHSLCHGDLGNLLLLDEGARTLAGTDPVDRIARDLPGTWRALLTDGTEGRWLTGVPENVETPGLMTGIAGVAWGLARMADPRLVPDLLTLAAPVPADVITAGGAR